MTNSRSEAACIARPLDNRADDNETYPFRCVIFVGQGVNAAIRSTPEVANGAVAYFAHLDALTRPIRDMQQRLEARVFRDTEPYLARATYVSDLGEEGKD